MWECMCCGCSAYIILGMTSVRVYVVVGVGVGGVECCDESANDLKMAAWALS